MNTYAERRPRLIQESLARSLTAMSLLVGAILAGTASTASAQNRRPGDVNNRHTSRFELMQKTSERWSKYHDYRATFVQIVEDPSAPGGREVRMGILWLLRDSEVKDRAQAKLEYYKAIPILKSDGQTSYQTGALEVIYATDGEALLQYIPGEKFATKRYLDVDDPFDELVLMLGLLQFDPDEIKKHYQPSLVTEIELNGHEVYNLKLEPVSPETSSLPSREIWLDREDLLPWRLAAYREGAEVEIDFHKQEVNTGLTQDEVTPEVPEGVRLNDLTME